MELQGAVDLDGSSRHESVEATPEYEGARSREVNETTERRIETDRAPTLSDREFATAPSAPSAEIISDERPDRPTSPQQEHLRTNDTETIPVTEEQFVVGKRAVEAGRVVSTGALAKSQSKSRSRCATNGSM